MVLQYVSQAYSCAYFMHKQYTSDILGDFWYPIIIAIFVWISIIALISVTAQKLKGRPSLYIPLYSLFTAVQIVCIISIEIKFGLGKSTVRASIMQLASCVGLSLYSCGVYEKLTVLYSHVCLVFVLTVALGMSLVLDLHLWVDSVSCFAVVTLWSSYVIHNLIQLAPTLSETEPLYAALMI